MSNVSWAWKPENAGGKPPRAKKSRVNQKRLAVIKHFGIHEHSSWAAIAHMISQETETSIPETNRECRKLVLRYRIGKRKRKKARGADDFYGSTAWKELRYIALSQSGGCCTLCGARASDGVQLHVDHIVPRSMDASKELDIDNLQILCEDCNIGKSNRDSIDWRE